MRLTSTLYLMTLFFVLTPGVLLTLPSKGSVYLVALVHAVVFGIVYKLTHKAVYRYFSEGFLNNVCTIDSDCNRPIYCDKTVDPSCDINAQYLCKQGTCVKTDGRG
jgi:hypothetical protein